ncbi:MAG: cupin domain-containing protein [Verrucomicrobia bacterium]|nr:cupin domain-containing protein [Verrucomicrobiota bacterium]MCH8525615.1 cupin domain-containing protein [Kiritimatiellia bacterium]
MLNSISPEDLFVAFGLDSARIGERPFVQRRLSDLRGCFADTAAYDAALAAEDPVLYEVTAVEPANGDGQLHYGLGILYPGKIGDEYFLTKGHYHSHRPAAEVYVGLKGEGAMLLEDEHSSESRMVPLRANSVVYVPGHTAHRTLNTGDTPLVYLGIYPSNAGHDYGAIADKNFRMTIVEQNGQPALRERVEGRG